MLSCAEVSIDKDDLVIDLEKLQEKFFSLTGFNLGSADLMDPGQMILLGQAPLSPGNAQHMLIYILPLLKIGKPITEILLKTKDLESNQARTAAFDQILGIPQVVLIHKKIEPIQVKFFMENIKNNYPNLAADEMVQIEFCLHMAVDLYLR